MATVIATEGLTFDDVLIKPQYSEINSRDDVDISTEIVPGLKIDSPIMSANMQAVNSIELCTKVAQNGGMATIDQFRSIEEEVKMIKKIKSLNLKIAGAVGTSKDYIERTEAVFNSGADVIVMDTPHAHNLLTKKAIENVRKIIGDYPLIVGNVATKEGALFLIHLGVDGIKVGIGPGAACTTRTITGAGEPQITALMECFDAAKSHGISIIADGGVKTPGAFAKAIAAGGDCVYLGSIFAGALESPAELIEKDGKKYKEYYGSSSEKAKIKRSNSDNNFKESPNRFVEGEAGYTAFQGSVHEIFERFEMGLKSAMSYTGAFTIKDFQDRAIFTILTQNGVSENGAHGLIKK